MQNCSVITEIIVCRTFPDSVVVVTSRPTATAFLYGQDDK